jgi:SAM-dependent methyltransferase
MKARHLIKGVFKSIPGIEYIYNFHRNTGGTDNAKYCYSVWLRHLVMAHENGMNSIPRKMAELGPGDSLGLGISALISGAEQYFALDIVRYSNAEKNLRIFDELITLFKNKSSIEIESEFPNVRPVMTRYSFPSHILTDEYMEKVLDENRLQRIRESIKEIDNRNTIGSKSMIQYRVPWDDDRVIEVESIDMIISQAVLQHVDDLEQTYKSMNKWLRKGGYMSHSIDLKSMGSADTWDGHWTYSDLEWKIVRGRKSYLINRESYSTHIKHFTDNRLNIICDIKSFSDSTILEKNSIPKRFSKMPKEDFKISGFFIQAIKPLFLFVCFLKESLKEMIYTITAEDYAVLSVM